MLSKPWVFVIAFWALCHVVAGGKVQSTQASANPSRRDAVKAAFQNSFNDYLKYAEGDDELLPLSKKGTGGFGNWGATYIDALTTAEIMGLDDIVKKGIAFAEQVDFTKTSQETISLFETNIRYVASLLSLYELTGSSNKKLVEQAQVIADRLLHGWVGTDIPYNNLRDWSKDTDPDTSKNAIIAEAGTLLLEFDRLSKFSGNKTYRNFAARSMRAVIYSPGILPGLYAQGIDPKTRQPTNDYVTWSGGSDSFFEYEIKYGYLIGSSKTYIPAWVAAVKSSIEYLLIKPAGTQANVTFLGDYSPSHGGQIPQFSHLGCFAGGNWILGGKLLDNDGIFQYGLALTDGCAKTYTSSVTGIGPELFVFKSANGETNGVTINNQSFYKKNGFDYEVVDYVLRPEVLESVFYAYRATGDQYWQDLAWGAFRSIQKYCKAPAAYAAISAVNSTQPEQLDDSESFLYVSSYMSKIRVLITCHTGRTFQVLIPNL